MTKYEIMVELETIQKFVTDFYWALVTGGDAVPDVAVSAVSRLVSIVSGNSACRKLAEEIMVNARNAECAFDWHPVMDAISELKTKVRRCNF